MGKPIAADEAVATGPARSVMDDTQLDGRAQGTAGLIASRPAVALKPVKQVALVAADVPLACGLLLQRRALELLFDTADQNEGMRAFGDRRVPVFAGR